jgi:hypothetical protein
MRKNIEIFFGKVKENKRLALRFEKENMAFMRIFAIAKIKICLNIKISEQCLGRNIPKSCKEFSDQKREQLGDDLKRCL